MYPAENLLPISALQHVLFCPRQCALIHVERLWSENYFTAQGRVLHERAHGKIRESRGLKRTETAVQVTSHEYGLYGECDVIDFFSDSSLDIIEYKRGKPKETPADRVQLCAQALCVEEMLQVDLSEAFLFYGQTKRRHRVELDEELRELTAQTIVQLHELIESRTTPPAQYSAHCKACSFYDNCKPRLFGRHKNIAHYIEESERQEGEDETDS